jgi:spore germination protein Q
MVQYYWNPPYQNQHVAPPQVTIPAGGRPPGPPQREQSYIENVLRLNIGQPGIFYFSFERALAEAVNTRNITGSVEAAGRDHVIVKEAATGRQFLFPMIYFDYAEFLGDVKYFNQAP